ncbi:MAG: hypothetical protein FJ279_12190, partial [Planctomycetes bacterium]|nr:hypothetical protein [Planctomycetota bacterium]
MLELIRLIGCLGVLTALSACFSAAGLAEGVVAKRALTAKSDMGKDVLKDGGFESAPAPPLEAWGFWQAGYVLDTSERRTGKQAIKCALTQQEVGKIQRGASQIIELNQTRPMPIVAGGWSKAIAVSGTPDSNYSVYLDVLFQDNTPLWGQTAHFSTGAHDWEYRERLVVPEKPIKSVTLHAIFRSHSGTAYFDDFTLRQLDPGAGAALFDSAPVVAGEPLGPDDSANLSTADGLTLSVSRRTGNFLLRDMAAASDFLRPTCPTRPTSQTAPPGKLTFTGQADALGLAMEATYSTQPNHIRIDALVRDLRGQDRAITAYFVLPLDALGGQWHDDMRRARGIETGKDYRNVFHVN